MKVYFVRHGESQGNVDGIHQHGRIELSPRGKQQAQVVAKRFKNIDIDVILSSDYTRAHDTARKISKAASLTIHTTPLLREIKKPTEIEGKKVDDPVVLKIRETITQHSHETDWRYADEETFFEVRQRVNQLIRELEQRTETNVLCVAHGDIIRTIIMTLLISDSYDTAIDKAIKKTMWIENTGITLCEFKNGIWKLLTWNDYAHLG